MIESLSKVFSAALVGNNFLPIEPNSIENFISHEKESDSTWQEIYKGPIITKH